jgi:hypothetical protein
MKLIKFSFIITLLIFSIKGVVAQSCAEGILYVMTGSSGTAASLYTMDPAIGATTLIGATGQSNLISMAIDPTTGDIYAVRSGSDQLFSIDITTGAATLIGAIGTGNIPDLTFDSAGNLYAWTQGSSDLVSINKTTGIGTVIPSSINTTQTGLAFDTSDNLYLKDRDEIHRIDPVTGVSLSFAVFPDNSTSNMLTFNSSDIAYSLRRTGGGFDLKTLDVTAGGGLTTVASGSLLNISAIEFCKFAIVPVPTLGEWALIIFTLLMLNLAILFVVRRRRQTKTTLT